MILKVYSQSESSTSESSTSGSLSLSTELAEQTNMTASKTIRIFMLYNEVNSCCEEDAKLLISESTCWEVSVWHDGAKFISHVVWPSLKASSNVLSVGISLAQGL